MQLSLRGMKRTIRKPPAKKPGRYRDFPTPQHVPSTTPLFLPQLPPEYVEMRRTIFGKEVAMPLYRVVLEKRVLARCSCCSLDNEAHQWIEVIHILPEGTTVDAAREALYDELDHLRDDVKLEIRNDRLEVIPVVQWEEV